MSVTIRVSGVAEALSSLRAYELRKRGALSLAVARTAVNGEAHVKRLISGPGPSSPGNPPGVDTGRLRASWRHRITGPHAGEVFTDVVYAPFLEFGTRRMAPRPHAGPTAEWMAGDLRRNATEALR